MDLWYPGSRGDGIDADVVTDFGNYGIHESYRIKNGSWDMQKHTVQLLDNDDSEKLVCPDGSALLDAGGNDNNQLPAELQLGACCTNFHKGRQPHPHQLGNNAVEAGLNQLPAALEYSNGSSLSTHMLPHVGLAGVRLEHRRQGGDHIKPATLFLSEVDPPSNFFIF